MTNFLAPGIFFKEGSGILQYVAAFLAYLNIITSGMHYGWPSPSLPILQDKNNTLSNIHITSAEGSWLAVMPLLGALLGSTIAGSTVNIIGRKHMIVLTSFPFVAAWIVVAYSRSVVPLCIARYMAGIADGCIFTSVPIYIGEISSPGIRGFLGSGVSVALISGILIINLLGSFFTVTTTALLSAIVPTLSFVFFIWMPRSPYWLLMKNKPEEARKSLQIFRGTSNVDEEFTRLSVAVREQTKIKGKFSDVVTVPSNRKALLIMMLLRAAQQLSGITAITFYTGHIFQEAGGNISPTLATNIFFAVQLLMTFFSSSIVDLTGRRPLLIISVVGSALTLVLEGTYFYFQTCTSVDLSDFSWVPITALIAYVVVFSLGLQTIPILMLGELFPTDIKAFALCFADLYFSILATLVSKFFQVMKDSFGIYVPFYAFAVSCILGLVLIVLFVPETKGKTLEEIQSILKGEHGENRKNKSVVA